MGKTAWPEFYHPDCSVLSRVLQWCSSYWVINPKWPEFLPGILPLQHIICHFPTSIVSVSDPKPASFPTRTHLFRKAWWLSHHLISCTHSVAHRWEIDLPDPDATVESKERESTWENQGSYQNSTCENRYDGSVRCSSWETQGLEGMRPLCQKNSQRATVRAASGVLCLHTWLLEIPEVLLGERIHGPSARLKVCSSGLLKAKAPITTKWGEGSFLTWESLKESGRISTH